MSSAPEGSLRGRPASIAARIVLLFTLCGFGLLALGSASLYQALRRYQFEQQRLYLLGLLSYVRAEIQSAGLSESEDKELAEIGRRVAEDNATRPLDLHYLEILDERLNPLLRSEHFATVLGEVPPFPHPVDSIASIEPIRWSRGGRHFLMTAATVPVRSGGHRIVRIAADDTEERRFLATYEWRALLVIAAGTLLCSLAAAWIARRALRPVREITSLVQEMDAGHFVSLGPAGSWPKELRALAGAFGAMVERLQESFTRLSRFSADLAHELRTPINNLMGETEVALSGERTGEGYRQVLESNLEELDRLSRLVDSCLFLARQEATPDGASQRVVRFPARKKIEDVVDFFSAYADENGIHIEVEGAGSVSAEESLFRRAVSNLLSNALQHTAPGGRIFITVDEQQDATEVKVIDNGTGIAGEHLPRIFDRFYRADASRSARFGGVGLGLSIVRTIMTAHGGTITIESEPGEGTCATLRFPHQGTSETPTFEMRDPAVPVSRP